jgi:hypothetical protein
MKSKMSLLLIIIIVCSIAFVIVPKSGLAQTGIAVGGIISSDTTWTKASSPYNLTGPAAVAEGVTLSIQAGTIVNINSYYLQVNGTLIAKGDRNERITFNGGAITFTEVSNAWNEQNGSGSVIENVDIIGTTISSSNALKIKDNLIGASILSGSSSLILNNNITGTVTAGNASIISNNTITGPVIYSSYLGIPVPLRNAIDITGDSAIISNNNIVGRITGGSANIVNNTITDDKTGWISLADSSTISNNDINLTGGITVGRLSIITNNRISGDITGTDCVISNNSIIGGITNRDAVGRPYADSANAISVSGSSIISNNTIRQVEKGSCGIKTANGNTIISNNLISGFGTGINSADLSTIENNIIINNQKGINLGTAIIKNNTFVNNTIGINTPSPNSTIIYNNIQNSTQYSIYLSTTANIDATYNWWGTIDIQIINQTNYDFKNDFNLGKVNFVPFLTDPNPHAPDISTEPTPTPTATPSPIPTSTTTPSTTTTPTPTPTNTPQPTTTTAPTQTPNPTPTPTVAPTQSPSTEPEETPSPTISADPTATTQPTTSPTILSSQEPTASPEQTQMQALPHEAIYGITIATIVTIGIIVVLLSRKRK